MTAQQYLTWLRQLYTHHGLPFEPTPPAAEDDLAALTTALGHETEIPPELAALWLLTEGGAEREELPFFQRPGYIDALQLLTPQEALAEAQAMQARAQRMWDEAGPASQDVRLTGRWWEAGWLPFASTGGGSIVLMVDNHPGPQGQRGQVIAFAHDPDEIEWYAASFSDYLQASKASIENDPEEFLLILLEEHGLQDESCAEHEQHGQSGDMSPSPAAGRNLLKDLQDWYAAQCNGVWEHRYGMKIDTLDDPGWSVVIDLKDTQWENLKMSPIQDYTDGVNWHDCQVSGRQYVAYGGPFALEKMIEIFFNQVIGAKHAA